LLDAGTVQAEPDAASNRAADTAPARRKDAEIEKQAQGAASNCNNQQTAANGEPAPQDEVPAQPPGADAVSETVTNAAQDALVEAVDNAATAGVDATSKPDETADPAMPQATSTPVVETQAPAVVPVVAVVIPPALPSSAAGAATPAVDGPAVSEATETALETVGLPLPGAFEAANVPTGVKPKTSDAHHFFVSGQNAHATSPDQTATQDTGEEIPTPGAGKPASEHADEAAPTGEAEKVSSAKDKKEPTLEKPGAKSGDAAAEIPAAARPATAAHASTTSNPMQALAPTSLAQGPSNAIAPATVPIAGLAVEIAVRARDGSNRFEIRLDPPELGRIDVRLDVDRHGNVTSRLIVERADTLDLLRSDAAGLERALSEAGLKTADNSLQFSLRDQTFTGDNRRHAPLPNGNRVIVPDADLTAAQTPYRLARRGGLDIRV
jgi:flagellar hook-length control protein FliK